MSIFYRKEDSVFTLSGGDVSYVIHVTPEGKLLNLYWGKRVPDGAIKPHLQEYMGFASFDMDRNHLPYEVPTVGQGWYGTPAVDVENSSGDHVVDLRYDSHVIYAGKKPLAGLPATYVESDSEAETLEIRLKDDLTGLAVTVKYTVFEESGAIARSMTVMNCGKQPMRLNSVMSSSVAIWGRDYDVVHLKGAWAREREIVRTPVGQGEYTVGSQRGASGHEENPFMALCTRNADETSGQVWAENLIYSGSFTAEAKVDVAGNSRLSIGMNRQVFRWLLDEGESFQTPETVLVYSSKGFDGMSHVFHKLYRTRLARGEWRDRERPVLINNWEATYFDFNEEKILNIAKDAKKLGIELFVLDDGWFGKRNSDNCSLGDWYVNMEKLPNGLSGLSSKIHDIGMMFGIWVEPEMISPDSDLYRAHPDWCLHVDGRQRTEERNQLILDLSRAEVQDYVIKAISDVLRDSNADYVKWDMNRNMTEYFSEKLPCERKMETQHRYMLGLYRVMETIVSSFPKVLFESCSGGGGRFDGGMLYYMPQTWTSDNTDAVARLSIQYGTSMVYPASAMGAHVSAVPNHQTRRVTPLEMRCNVALGGNFGFELDLTKMTAEEKKTAAAAVEQVKAIRGLTEQGVFSRLISPVDGKYAAWQFVSDDGSRALLCVYHILSVADTSPIRVKMVGLDENAVYVAEDGTECYGAELVNRGLPVWLYGDFSSKTILFTKVSK